MQILQKRKVTYRQWKFPSGGVPAVIIEGKFLSLLGFKLGSYYKVDYQPGLIVISSIKDEPNQYEYPPPTQPFNQNQS